MDRHGRKSVHAGVPRVLGFTDRMQEFCGGLEFGDDAVKRIAEIAWQVNESTENIGARRLHTMLERLLETISFEASDRSGDTATIDAEYVQQHLQELAENEDYARYIL